MRRWLCGALLAALGFAAHAQVTQADMEGSWQVYPVRQLSRYTLSEHQAGGAAAIRGAGVLQLNADGTLTTDVPDIEALRWSVDEGFLMLETGAGRNLFFKMHGKSTFIIGIHLLKHYIVAVLV